MTRSKAVIGLIVLAASCTSARLRSEGTVSGIVTAGPVCPVEIPGDPACAPVAVVGSVEFLVGGEVVASSPIEDGQFASTQEVGDYTMHINVGESPFPSCPDQPLTVVGSARVTVNVTCDTGIRGPGS